MNLTVIGVGYVGLSISACLSEMGNRVICIDRDQKKIDDLQKGIIPIYEPGLSILIKKNTLSKNLLFTTDLTSELNNSDAVFITVGTPIKEDGMVDVSSVLGLARQIGNIMTRSFLIINKSTVPIGTTEQIKTIITDTLNERKITIPFDVVFNPEFLKEGSAINDFMKPDRIILGMESTQSLPILKKIYAAFTLNHNRLITMDIRSAEMTKYAANTMLATKISFINEIANICEKVNADINKVRIGIGSDKRIGYDFIYPGVGYGGSCLPKDVRMLKNIAKQNGYDASLISAVEKINEKQKFIISDKIIKKFGPDLKNFTFGLWGLAFKSGTNDMRESAAIYLVKELVKRGGKIKAYDPKAMDNSKKNYLKGVKNISYTVSKYDALQHADAMILLTEWKEFRAPDFDKIKKLLNQPIIFDGRNQYDIFDLEKLGFEYHKVGKK